MLCVDLKQFFCRIQILYLVKQASNPSNPALVVGLQGHTMKVEDQNILSSVMIAGPKATHRANSQ